jgi:hypothetical protein
MIVDSIGNYSSGAFLIYAYHTFDVHKITEVLEILPTSIRKQKKLWLQGKPGIPQCSWRYKLPPQKYNSIEEPINEILDIFLPKKDILIPFLKVNNLDAWIDILINFYESNFKWEIDCNVSSATAKKLAALNTKFLIYPYLHSLGDMSFK